jgi:hypothetical protein
MTTADFSKPYIFHGARHHLAGAAQGIWQLEQHLEAVLAAEPFKHVRGI